MQFQKNIHKKFKKGAYSDFILAGDIGGTNTKLGLFGISKKLPELLASFNFKSQEMRGLHESINKAIECINDDYSIKIKKGSLAVAGVISPNKDFADVTNAPWNVDKKLLLDNTMLKKIIILNDFEAIGYGINMLKVDDIMTIKKSKKIPKAPIVVVGAGTGLGKTTLIYHESLKSYIPLHCEAGHTDFPSQSKEELNLVGFIKKRKKIRGSIPYEQILSGQGLENLYFFVRKNMKLAPTRYTKEIEVARNKAELISKYRNADKTCFEVFRLFQKAFSKFARNFALDSIAWGGVYIAGGIIPKNKGILDGSFVRMFEENYMLGDVLKAVPIHLIVNYDVGLLGAGFVGAKLLE